MKRAKKLKDGLQLENSFLVGCLLLCMLIGSATVIGYRYKKKAQTAPVATPLIIPKVAPYRALCEPSPQMAHLSSSGRFAVLMEGRTADWARVSSDWWLTILDLTCLAGGNSFTSCGTVLSASNPVSEIRALGWSADEQYLYVVRDRKELVRLRVPSIEQGRPWEAVDSATLSKAAGRWGVAIGQHLKGQTAPELAVQLDAWVDEAMRQTSADERLLVAGGGEHNALAYVAMAPESLALKLYSQGKASPLNVLATELRDGRLGTIGQASSARLALVGAGVPLGTGLEAPRDNELPFARPLTNSSGELVGQFSPFQLRWHGVNGSLPPGLQKLDQSPLRSEGWSYRGVAVNEDGTSAVALMRSGADGGLVRFEGPQGSWQFMCPNTPATLPKTGVVELGTSTRRLDLWATSVPHPVGTLLYFGGGPSSSPRDDVFYVTRQFLERGWNVAVVAQSGSNGDGLEVSQRLRREGFAAAIERDAEAVARYVARLPAEHRVVLVGTSFGGTGAAATSRHLDRKHALVLIAPWMRYRTPDSWVEKISGTPLIPTTTPDNQERFEAATFGIARGQLKSIQPQLDAIYGVPSKAARIFAAFASADTVSRSGDLPAAYRGYATLAEIPGTHDFVEAQDELWDQLRTWLPL